MSHTKIIVRSPNQSGELGAAAIRVNVDFSGYSLKDLDSPGMISSIKATLVRYGWSVSSVSVSKSSTTGIFYISVAIKAARNTADELEKIKNGVGTLMETIFNWVTISASFAGAAAQTQTTSAGKNVSTFSFQISSIGSEPLRDRHAQFNQLLVNAFPKLLYTNPSSSYTDAGLASIAKFGGASQIAAVGETALTPAATKSTLVNFLAQSNISTYGNIMFDQKTISELESGAKLTPPKILSGGQDTNLIPPIKDWWKDLKLPNPDGNFLDILAGTLGISIPTAIVGGFLVIYLLRR